MKERGRIIVCPGTIRVLVPSTPKKTAPRKMAQTPIPPPKNPFKNSGKSQKCCPTLPRFNFH